MINDTYDVCFNVRTPSAQNPRKWIPDAVVNCLDLQLDEDLMEYDIVSLNADDTLFKVSMVVLCNGNPRKWVPDAISECLGEGEEMEFFSSTMR